jgi:hypothetical protein
MEEPSESVSPDELYHHQHLQAKMQSAADVIRPGMENHNSFLIRPYPRPNFRPAVLAWPPSHRMREVRHVAGPIGLMV